jgi:intein/homing endonuclease
MHFKPQRKIKINWSPNFAYAIGLIVSDGYLSSDARHIGFKSADRELVEKFKIAIGIQNKIGGGARSNEKVKKYFYVTFGDIVFYRFLNEIGIKSAKSKIIKSIIVPDEFFKDFLRGLFDGDGTFYSFWDKRWKSSFCYQISFASASPNFISWLKTKLNKLYNVKGFIRKGDGVFNLRYVKGDTRRLFTIMYGNKENQLFLERKYIKIIRALDKDRK